MSESTQFEGRTAEEAVARARKALGDSGALRCWKTRRGGVGGFFAREVFVASLTPPPGSETTRGRTSRVQDGTARGNIVLDDAPAEPRDPTRSVGACRYDVGDGNSQPDDLLAGLVESTSDAVSLGSLAIPADAFDQVLAEAEAALSDDAGDGDVAPTHQPALPETQMTAEEEHRPDLSPDEERTGHPPEPDDSTIAPRDVPLPAVKDAVPTSAPPAAARRAKRATPSKARPRQKPPAARAVPVRKPAARGHALCLPDLKPGLRSLGVPNVYLPRGQCPSLDLLAVGMAALPPTPALPTRPGVVVAVVGAGENLDRTVDLLAAEMSLGRRDVLRVGETSDRAGPDSPDGRAAGRRVARQLTRRRVSGASSVVAVQAAIDITLQRDLGDILDGVVPDFVVATIGAECKRVDVEHWIASLLTVDALALWGLAGTRTPGELLGLVPIAYVDGEESSPLGWTLLLAGRAARRLP